MMLSQLTPLLALLLSSSWIVSGGTVPPSKRATCVVASAGSASTDDVPAITAAIKSCGNGGIIQLSAGKTYQLRSVLDFAGCTNCDFQVEGTLKASADTSYWSGRATMISINSVSGLQMHSVTGTGVIDGNGQPYWTLFGQDSSYARPTLVKITGTSSNINIHDLKFKNPPNVFHSNVSGTKSITYSGLTLTAAADAGQTVPKNTDGFDVSGSYVTIANTKVTNQDDCVAFKPGANYVTVTDITCKGSHGLSVGSLGKSGADTVTNVIVSGATMIDSTKGMIISSVGIKLYDGETGHVAATVKNVTFTGVIVQNSDYAVQIQSCYNAASTSACTSSPGKSVVDGVYFKNFSGTTSSKYDPTTGNLNCSPSQTCNVYVSGYTVKAPSGKSNVLCSNIDSTLGISCSGAASG